MYIPIQSEAVKTFQEERGTFHKNPPITTQVSAMKTIAEVGIPIQSVNSPVQAEIVREDRGTPLITVKCGRNGQLKWVKFSPLRLQTLANSILISQSTQISVNSQHYAQSVFIVQRPTNKTATQSIRNGQLEWGKFNPLGLQTMANSN